MSRVLCFALALVVLLSQLSEGAVAATQSPVTYSIPVDARVSLPFNAPGNPYAAGNRGTEFSVRSGDRVTADADGTVAFAGRIGASQFVSIDHADGLRTTLSYLAKIHVEAGQAIRAGALIGSTTDRFQWGARIGDHAYLDPMLLVATGTHAHLVPDRSPR